MSVWNTRSCWTSTVLFDVETTADVTGLKPDTIYHYLSRNDPKFPQPTINRGRLYFCGEDVFRYIVDHRRKATTSVPRLFPRNAEPDPAQFIGAQRVGLPDSGHFAVHIWQPADAGPPVAIAYPDRENCMKIIDGAEIASSVLNKFLPPEVTALAVAIGETAPPEADFTSEHEPTIVVAERNPVYRPRPAGRDASYYRWSDLANLLRVDIPWWPPLVRELDAMLTWQPGAAVMQIKPYAPRFDTGHITALATPRTAPDVRGALEKLANYVLARLHRGARDDRTCLTPGLVHAAISTIDITQPAPPLTAGEAAAVLHHRAHEHLARHALRVAGHLAFKPHLTHVIQINRESATSTAWHWISRLTDVDHTRRTELGFWFVNNYVPSRVRSTRWLADPDNPHTWIIQGDNGTVYAGVGTTTPGAQGQLCGAEIDVEAAFFWDTDHHVWPLPAAGFGYYGTGHRGGGPQRLADTLTALAYDAASDAHEPPTLPDDSTALRNALYQLVTQHHAPFTITADFISNASNAEP